MQEGSHPSFGDTEAQQILSTGWRQGSPFQVPTGGLQEPFISRVLDEMGTAALSDDAVGKLAEMHLAAERRKSAQLDRDAKGYRGR